MLSLSRTCQLSNNQLVNFVARHAVWYGRMRSPFGMNVFHCCQWFDVASEDLWAVSSTYISKAIEARNYISQIYTARAILELVFARSGFLEFSDMSNGTRISACEIDAFIQFLWTSKFLKKLCTLCTIFIINICIKYHRWGISNNFFLALHRDHHRNLKTYLIICSLPQTLAKFQNIHGNSSTTYQGIQLTPKPTYK